MVINRHEEELLDVPNAEERNKRFFEYLNRHNYDPDVLPYNRIKRYRRIARELRRKKEADAIATYLDIESDLRDIFTAIKSSARDLDGWIQERIDLARGK